jgi:hypothetical protein
MYLTTLCGDLTTFQLKGKHLYMSVHGRSSQEHNADDLMKMHDAGQVNLPEETQERIRCANRRLRGVEI